MNKLPFGKQDFRYFTGYRDAEKIRPLCTFRPKMSIYKIFFDKTKRMYFLIKHESFFDKYNEIWGKKLVISSKKEFSSEPVNI